MRYYGPPPGTASPRYEQYAYGVRTGMRDHAYRTVMLPKFYDTAKGRGDLTLEQAGDLEIVALTIRRMSAPAPYVGRPFVYTWKVAVDDNDEGIADTEVSIRYEAVADLGYSWKEGASLYDQYERYLDSR